MHLPLSFRVVDREGFASAIGNLAGDSLQQGVVIDVADVTIPRKGAVVGRFGIHESGLLPEFIVVRDEDLADTYAWASAYFTGLAPITQWCRVWRQSEFARLDLVSEVSLGRRVGPWIGAIIGECLVQGSYRLSLKEMPGSAALATTTYVAARASAIWGDLLDLDDIGRRYDDLQQRYRTNPRPLAGRDLIALWFVLSDSPMISRAAAHQRALSDLSSLLDDIASRGMSAIKAIARQAASHFNLPELGDCAEGAQSHRVEAVDRLARRLLTGPASPSRDALLGFGASLVDPGVAALPDLLRQYTDRMPMAPLWLGAFAGAWSPAKVLNDNQGLGRLILKSLEAQTDLGDRPNSDIAYDELARWLGSPGSKRPTIRAMSSRNLNVEILPGVVAPFSLTGEVAEPAAVPRVQQPQRSYGGGTRTVPRDDSSVIDRTMRDMMRRIEEIEARLTSQTDMLPGLDAPEQKQKVVRRGSKARS